MGRRRSSINVIKLSHHPIITSKSKRRSKERLGGGGV